MSPSDARFVVRVHEVLTLRGPGIGGGVGVALPEDQSVREEVCLTPATLCEGVCVCVCVCSTLHI